MTNEEFIQSITLPGEEWRDVVGNSRYAVSSFGRVLAYSAPYKCGDRTCRRKQQLIKPRIGNTNPSYLSVVLSDGAAHRKSTVVHRLVAEAFIPNPDKLPYVNHKDENSRNNRVENLEWCTQQYNCNYGTHNIRMAKTISDTAYQRKKVVQLSLDNILIAVFDSITLAGRSIGVGPSLISACCRGVTTTGYGFRWMYLSDYESLVQYVKELTTKPPK